MKSQKLYISKWIHQSGSLGTYHNSLVNNSKQDGVSYSIFCHENQTKI